MAELMKLIDERIARIESTAPINTLIENDYEQTLRALKTAVEALEKYENTHVLVMDGGPALKHRYYATEALTQIETQMKEEV